METTASRSTYLLVFLFFAAVLASYSLVESSLFTLTEVEVRGAETLDPERIRQMSGLVPGESLFTLDLGAVEERLREEPRVASVRARRRWPDGVILSVVERRPLALLSNEGTWLAVDPSAVLFPADPGWKGALPILTGVDAGTGAPGSALGEQGRRLLGLLSGPAAPISQRASELHLDEQGEVILYLRDPVRVQLGRLDLAPSRLPVLLAVLRDLDARGARPTEIDLRFDSPVIRSR
ncbi:cell division protein FtsQ/DivIB [Limnochorda pilosa]|uniref:POTRA domain-containing protein n=1 Tax=Limnochorda pilosa TaxID=1555112 RepID=A0A0K2SKS2_LIMPI|nr:FtsQ-type POTRA domain-containing protein [Limnochorda pilosa]BAS27703.1 hypothetical protein LIP_1860 [Limnochorda pilosa]